VFEAWPGFMFLIAVGVTFGLAIKRPVFGRALLGLICGLVLSATSALLGFWAWKVPLDDLLLLRVISQGVIGVACGYVMIVTALVAGLRWLVSKF
jgi:hypothetical protein